MTVGACMLTVVDRSLIALPCGLARRSLRVVGLDPERLRYGRIPVESQYHAPISWGEAGNAVVSDILQSGQSCLVARLGGVEARACTYWTRWRARRLLQLGWPRNLRVEISRNAGFFPVNAPNLDRFARLYLDSLSEADVLAVWLITPDEHVLARTHCPDARLVNGTALDSMIYADPWSAALEGKRVLVIHPFAASIERQYRERRELLYRNPKVLPPFELTTIRAVQSIAGNPVGFPSWFDAFEHMCGQIDRAEFDIAIIGAGAYGLPLGAHVKRSGRQAVHLGGVTQMLFGVVGRRWQVEYDERYSGLVNEAWVRPSPDETPAGHAAVEGGCYW